MATADAIFRLIKSLAPSEKVLVRQVDKSQSAYLALFDILHRQESYDERAAKKKLIQQGHDINFAYAKNYLTKHILRVLRDNESNGQQAATRQVQEIQLLMRRKIYDLAGKLLQKAREKSLEEERWDDFLQLSNIEMELLVQGTGDLAEGLAAIDRLNAERQRARAMQANLGAYEDIYHRYRPVLMRKHHARNEFDLAFVQDFAAQPIMADISHAQSKRAERIYHLCHTLIQTFLGNLEATQSALQNSIALYQAQSWLQDDFPAGYINALWRLGGYQLHVGNYLEVERILTEINLERSKRGIHDAELFEKYSRLLVSYALTTQRYALMVPELAQVEQGLKQYGELIPWTSQSVLIFLMGRLHFEQGNYREAKKWFNQILDHPDRGQRQDITSLARMLLIFVYFEQGDSDLAEASSKATRKYLQRRDALYHSERRILRFMEQNAVDSNTGDLLIALKALRSDLQEIFKDPLEVNVLAFFDIMAWLDIKIQGLS